MSNIGLIGKKIGMSREFFPMGLSVPVTVIKIEKGRVLDLITKEKRGYDAIRVGFGKIKPSKLTKSMKGFYSKKSTEPKKYLKEYRVENISNFNDKINKNEKEHLEKHLLHFYNLIEEKKGYLILTASNSPKFWGISLPDLKSRILSSINVKIKKPDDELLSSVLIKLFLDKQILIDKKIIKFIVYRSERSLTNLQKIVNRIDKQSLITKKKINISFVKKLI